MHTNQHRARDHVFLRARHRPEDKRQCGSMSDRERSDDDETNLMFGHLTLSGFANIRPGRR